MKDLQQIQQDLGRFSEDQERYTEKFQGLIQSFDLTWRVISIILNQSLTKGETRLQRLPFNLGMTYI